LIIAKLINYLHRWCLWYYEAKYYRGGKRNSSTRNV